MNLIGQIINGMKIVGNPQRSGIRGSNYKYPCECVLCGKNKNLTLQSLRNRKTYGCGCSIDGLITKHGVSFKQWCVDNHREDLLALWDDTLNDTLPEKVSSQSQTKRWFKCSRGIHESFLYFIPNLTRRPTHACFCSKCNSFAQHFIDTYGNDALEKYWDYSKNTVDPWNISYGSKDVIYIKCINKEYHGSYSTTPQSVSSGRGCPYCRCTRVHPLDSFAAYCSREYGEKYLGEIWDYEKNTLNPWEIAPYSNVYVYLKCKANPAHRSFLTFLPNVFKTKYDCPCCALSYQDSKLQMMVMEYIHIQYGYDILHEYDCTLKVKNPKTNRWLRYDNDVLLPNNKHLIIEVHGMQHFIAQCGYNNKRAAKLSITPEQVLIDQQWRDEYKKQYAIDNGYHYLAIPYWTEQDKSYQTLIDDKISEILSINTTK